MKQKKEQNVRRTSPLENNGSDFLSIHSYSCAYHTPVLLRETIVALNLSKEDSAKKVVLDCTLGGGGHSLAILENSHSNTTLFSVDRDPEAIKEASLRLQRFTNRWTPILGNYGDAPELMKAHGIEKVDALLLDAGVSSHQLDDATRGFSYRQGGPLDMRMGPDAMTVEELLADSNEEELGQIIAKYGEMSGAFRIGRAVKRSFDAGNIHNTVELAAVVEENCGKIRQGDIHPATLVFQAFRIAANRELESLEKIVDALPSLVKKGGRVAMISFHSLEDRIVKEGFLQHASDCNCPPGIPYCSCDKKAELKIITKKPLQAKDDEIAMNPRARSAKLRVAEIL